MSDRFRRIATLTSQAVGTPWAFMVAVAVVLVWALSGPFFRFSSAWQLAINSSTTIATFLTVFLIQSTQNRDARAMQLKLDELVHAIEGARDLVAGIEEGTDAEMTEAREGAE